MLTGVMNRNTMNNDVDKVADGKGEISAPYAMRIADERMFEDKKGILCASSGKSL